MTPLNEFVNELNSLAKSEELPISETKKRLLSLADKMDKAGVSKFEKFAYRAIELIGEFPNNAGDVMNLLISCAKEDWIRVGEAARPLLDIEDIRELSKKAGMKPSI